MYSGEEAAGMQVAALVEGVQWCRGYSGGGSAVVEGVQWWVECSGGWSAVGEGVQWWGTAVVRDCSAEVSAVVWGLQL